MVTWHRGVPIGDLDAKAVERVSEFIRNQDGYDEWPSNTDLGGKWGLGTRDDEYRAEVIERAVEWITVFPVLNTIAEED